MKFLGINIKYRPTDLHLPTSTVSITNRIWNEKVYIFYSALLFFLHQ